MMAGAGRYNLRFSPFLLFPTSFAFSSAVYGNSLGNPPPEWCPLLWIVVYVREVHEGTQVSMGACGRGRVCSRNLEVRTLVRILQVGHRAALASSGSPSTHMRRLSGTCDWSQWSE